MVTIHCQPKLLLLLLNNQVFSVLYPPDPRPNILHTVRQSNITNINAILVKIYFTENRNPFVITFHNRNRIKLINPLFACINISPMFMPAQKLQHSPFKNTKLNLCYNFGIFYGHWPWNT